MQCSQRLTSRQCPCGINGKFGLKAAICAERTLGKYYRALMVIKGAGVTDSTRNLTGSIEDPAEVGGYSEYRNGAPRPTKMGTIASLWRYDSVAGGTLQLASLGCYAIQHYASWSPDIVGWLG